jgi:hypothetical protein
MPALRISSTTARANGSGQAFRRAVRVELGLDVEAHLLVARALHQVEQVRKARECACRPRLLLGKLAA